MKNNCFQAQLLNKSGNTYFALIITAMNNKYFLFVFYKIIFNMNIFTPCNTYFFQYIFCYIYCMFIILNNYISRINCKNNIISQSYLYFM